jgi:succinate-acetate transporter protein
MRNDETEANPVAQRSRDIDAVTRVVLRPMATPLPLGFLALAVGSALLTSLQLGWVSSTYSHQAALAVLTLVAPLELIAAVFAFLIRDVVMATGLGLLTGSWAAFGALLVSGPPGTTNPVVGVLAVAVGGALLVPAISAGGSKPVAAVIMAVAAARFVVTGVYEFSGTSGWQTAAGVIGVALLATAAYGSLALALEDAHHHAVLPVNRRRGSYYAMTGDLSHQLTDLPSEAGVRQEA